MPRENLYTTDGDCLPKSVIRTNIQPNAVENQQYEFSTHYNDLSTPKSLQHRPPP